MVISQLKLTSPLRDRQVKQEQSDTEDQCMMILFHLSQNCEFGGAKKHTLVISLSIATGDTISSSNIPLRSSTNPSPSNGYSFETWHC